MTQYFREPKSLGKAKVELDLSNYAQKTDLNQHHLFLKRLI